MATLPITPSATRKSATKAAVAKPKPVPVPAAAALPAPVGPVAAPEPAPTPALAPSPPLSAPLSASAASASATTKSAVYKINARRKAIQEVLFKDSDLVLLLEDGRSLLVKDGALQFALQQSFILQFDEERVLSTEFIQNHPKVNYSLGNLDDKLLFSSGVVLPTYDGDLLDLTLHSDLPADAVPPPSAAKALPVPIPAVDPFINKYLGLGALAAGALLAAKGASSQSGAAVGTAVALAAPANTLPPLLSLGRGVADGATAAEATDSAGVVILNASSGNTVVVTLVDSSANTLTKTLTGTGYDQPVVLAASDIGSGPGQLQEGVISVSALASGSGGVRSSNGSTTFTLDTTAATLKDLALTANVGDGSTLKAGDVLTLTATYDSVVIGNPTPPTLSIGSKTGIALTPKDTSGSVRSWTYTISNNGTPDSGAIALSGGDYLQGVTDSAGNPSTNPAAGAPQLKPLSFYVDSSTPARPALSFGLGVDNGATAAEALASSGVLSLSAESGTRVEVSFTNGTRSFTKTLAATGNSQPVVLGADEVAQLQDGSINVSAIATSAANIPSSPGITGFNLDTQAPVLRRISLLSSNAASNSNPATPLRPGDVLTLTAEYSEDIEGSPAPTLQIGSETGVAMTPLGTSGQSRVWTYTISQTDSVNNPADQGAITVEGLGSAFVLHVHDRAGNPASSASPAPTQDLAFSADTSTPTAPTLTWGAGVSGGATAAEATQSSGVVLVAAESGTTVVLTFSDSASPANSVSKTITANGSTAQAVTLAASEIGNSGNALHDGTITVSAVATNAALVSSSNSVKAFTLDTTAPVLNSLALASSSGNNALKLGDVLTYSASYDGPVEGSISAANAPTLTIGSETGIRMTPGITTGSTRTWTYTIRKSTGGSDLDDSGAVSVVGGNYLSGIADAAGNLATGAPTSANGSFSADANTPKAPTLTWGAGVSGGATAAEATQSSGVVLVTAESGTTVVLTFSDSASPANSVSKTITANGSTAQAVTLAASEIGNSGSLLHDGTITVSAVATNAALVSSNASSTSFALDTIQPIAPSLPLPAYASGGVSRAEALSSAGVLALTAESGSTVLVTFSDSNNHLVHKTLVGTGSAQPLVLLATDLGNVSGTGSSALGEGTITVTAIATDAAGNRSLVGSSSFTLDTLAPTLPALSGLAFSDDSATHGASNADFMTKVQSQTITATLAASLASGETLRGSVDGGGSWADLTAQLTSGTQLNWAVNLLVGQNQLLLKVSDAAGNDSAITSQAYELDQSAPTQLVTALALGADTAAPEASSTNSDFITRTAAQSIRASLSAALGSKESLWASLDGGANWVHVTPFVSGTSLHWSGVSLLAGTNTLLLKVADQAGNDGTVRSQVYEVDTSAPTTAVATVVFTNDAGRSSSDLITSQASQIIQGSLGSTVQAGETVYVSVNAGSVWLAASSTVGSSSYSLAGATLLDGSNVLLIKVCDVAGNSGPVVTRSYTLDTSPPNPPALLLGSGVADGTTADEATASSGVLTLSAESGASVVVTFSDGVAAHDIVKTLLGTGSAQPITLDASDFGSGSGKLQDGSITVAATATDIAGNVGGASSTRFILDTQPDTPVFALGTGVSDGATLLEASQATGVVTLSAPSGAIVRVVFSDSHSDASPAHTRSFTITATGLAQPLTLQASDFGTGSGQLHEGTITVTASATDAAGNVSPDVSTTFTLDTIAPAIPVLAVIPSVATGGASRAEATDSAGVLTVNAELLSTVRLTFSNGTQSLTKVLTGSGNPLAVTLNSADLGTGSKQLQDGSITVTATATDVAGNPSTNTANTATFTLDTRAPEAPIIVLGADVQAGATLADALQSRGVVLVSAEAASVVNVTFGNGTQSVIRQFTATGSAQAVTLNASDIGSANNQLQDGTITVTARATDAAGNSSSSSSSFVLDTRFATTQLLALGSGVAGFTVASEATQSSGVVTLDAESGSSVWVTFTDANNTSIVKTLIGSGVAGQAVTLGSADFGGFASQLHDGLISVSATGIDRAGNVSTAFSSFVLDTQAPAQAHVVLRQRTAAGVLTLADLISAAGLFQFNAEPGASVRAEFTCTDAVGGVSTLTKTFFYNDSLAASVPWQAASLAVSDVGTAANQLRPGSVSLRFVTVDAAGNASPPSQAATFTLDTSAYAAPVLTLLDAAKNGVTQDEVDRTVPVFSYQVPGASEVTFALTDSYGNSYEQSIHLTADSLEGDFYLSPLQAFRDGLISVSAVASSLAGSGIGTGPPGSASLVLDTTAPRLVAVTRLSSNQIRLFFTEPIDDSSSALTLAAANSLFPLKNSSDTTLTGPFYSAVSVAGSTVTLTLHSGFSPDNSKIGYEPPTPAADQTTGVVQDRAGNDMARSSFSWATDAQKAYSSPTANSMIVGFTVTDAHGSPSRGKAGEVVSVDVRFSNTIALSANTSYSVTVDIDGSNGFSALLTTGASTQIADHFAFTGTLPSTSGITSNALSIRDKSVGLPVSNTNLRTPGGDASHVVSTDYLVDSTAPSVSLTQADSQSWSNTVPAGHSANIQFTFSENPGSSFGLDSLAGSTGGSFSNLTGYGQVRYATFTPTPNTNNGSAAIRVAAGSYTDAAGNAGAAAAATFSLGFDTAPPTPPILNLGTGIADGATAAEAAQASGVLTVQAESGQAVVLTFTDSAATAHSLTKTVTGAGMASAVAVVLSAAERAVLADGAVTVLAVATDAAGNSSRSNSGFTLDAAAPAASGFVFASGGTSDASTITVNSPIVTVTGLGAGDIWQYSLDSATRWTVGTGSSFQVESNTSYAPNAIRVKISDRAGNTSSISQLAKTLVLDSVAPVAPGIAFAPGLGLKTAAGAGVVNIQAESGSTVVVRFSDGSHSVTKTVTGLGANNVPITLAASDLGSGNALLLDGSISVTAVATDSAGNASAASTSSFALNSSAPALFVKSGQDRFVNHAETGVDIEVYSAVLQTGDLLVLQIDGATFAGNTQTVTPTEAAAGRVRFAISSTALAGSGDGNKSLTATRTALGGTAVNSSTALTLTLDTAAPAAPALALGNAAIHGATLAEATASSGVVLVTAESGASVVVTFSDGAHSVIQTVTSLGANSPLPVSLSGTDIGSLNSQLREGSISVRAVATDAAGNTSAASSSSWVLDTSKPGTPTLALGNGVGSGGASRGEAVSSLLTFTAESGSTAWLSFSDGVRTLNKTFAVNSSAPQTIALLATELGTGTSQLHDGSINVSAVVLDAAGNVSAAASTRFVLDSTVPDAPVLLLNAGVADYGASRAKAIGSQGVLTVTAESGTTVTVTFSQTIQATTHVVKKNIRALGSQNAVPVALAIADFGNNNNQLADGISITVTAETVDQAGNTSAVSDSLRFTLSTSVPPAPTLQWGAGVSDVANRAEATQPDGVVTVNSVSGMQAVVTFSDGVRFIVKTVSVVSTATAVTLDAADLGTASSQQLRDGTITVWAVSVDQAGNVSPSSASRTFTMDATPPVPPVLLTGIGIEPGGATRYEALDPNGVVNVRAEPGSIISVTFSDGLPQHHVIKTFTGTGSAQTVVLLEQDIAATAGSGQAAGKLNSGVINVTAVATDAAGNTSEQGRTAFLLDTVAPNLLISSDRSILKAGETATITFSFSELPDTFSLDMVQVSGGTLSNLNNVNTPTRTATFTPHANTNSGNASIRIAAGTYSDTAGNIGSASNTFIQRFDTKAPAIVSASLIGQTIVLNFDSDIDPDALSTTAVANRLFTYKKQASAGSSWLAIPHAFTNVLISGSKVTLALATPLGAGESATVSYSTSPNTDLAADVVQDLVGNDLVNFADLALDTRPVITEFVVSDGVFTNGPALGKGGEAVLVTVTFSTPVKFLKNRVYTVVMREGSIDREDSLFGASFYTGVTDVTGTSFEFKGSLRTTEGISTNTLRLTDYAGEAGSITSTIGNLAALTQNSYNLFSSAYTVDTLAPTTGISSHQGVSLDASQGQYVALPAALGFMGGDITLEAWVYAEGTQQNGATILNLGSAGSNNISLNLYQGKWVFEAFNGSNTSLGKAISFQPLALDSWSHLAVTVSASNVLTLYVNGLPVPFSLDGATTATSATLSGTIPEVARSSNSLGTATPAFAFNGTISDLRIYNYARSTVQIQGDQLGAVEPNDDRLLGYYPFGGRQGLALNPGNGQYVVLPAPAGAPPASLGGDITLETWVYANGQQNAQTTFLTLGSAGNNNITLSMAHDVGGVLLGFEAFNGATSLGKAITISDKPLAVNTWNHVAVRVSAARELTLYVNGEPVAFSLNNASFKFTATLTGTIPEAARSISLGSATAANVFNGTISDLRIYSNARSADQIQLDGLIAVDPNDSNLVGHYPFNTTPNSGLTDGLSATIHGGAVYRSIALLSLSADTGSSPKDFTTKTARQTITGTLLGTLDDGDRVYGSLDEGKTWLNTNISTSGSTVTWAYVTLQQPLSSGQPRTIRLLVRDAAGNDGPIVTQTYVLDTLPPVPTLTLGSGVTTGASRAEATQTSGVLTINADSGSIVVVSFSDGSHTVGKTIIATATTARQPIPLDATDLGTGANQLQDGTITATANVTDLAGNTTLVMATASFTLDTTAPLQTVALTPRLSSDNGASATDFVSNNPAQTITATLSAALAAGAAGISAESLWGSLDNGGSWTDLGGFVTGTVLVWPGLTLTGSNSLQLQVRDLAGNVGPAFSQAYVIDTTPPAAPAITLGTGIQASPSANGASKTEATQTSGVLTVAGEAQATVRVTFSDSAATPNRIVKSIITSGFGSAIAVSLDTSDMGTGANQLRDGTITVTASITDLAGNLSTPSASTTFKLDTVAPQLDFRQGLALDASRKQFASMPYLQSNSGTISGDMTLAAWIYVNGELNADMPIIYLDSGGAGNAIAQTDKIALTLNSQGALVFAANNATATSIMTRVTSTGAITPYKWHHVAVTVSNHATGIAVNLYVNGAIPSGSSGSAPNNTPIPAANRSNAYIGYGESGGVGSLFNGFIADVRVYDNERTAEQIAADQSGNANSADSSLKAYYPFAGNADSGLSGTPGLTAALTTGTGFATMASLQLGNDTAPNNTRNHDFVFKTAPQTIGFDLLNPFETGETIFIDGVGNPANLGTTPGSTRVTLNNVAFTEGSNTLRIKVSDVSGNTGPEYTQTFRLDTAAPANGLAAGLQFATVNHQYATLPAAAGAISGDLTLEAWINYAPVANGVNVPSRNIIKLGSGAQTGLIVLNLDFTSGSSTGKLQFRYEDGNQANRTFTVATALTPNIWNHVAATVDASNILKLYVNGVAGLTSGSAIAIPAVTRNDNFLGRWNVTPSFGVETEFNGYLRDVRIYDAARSQAGIQSDMNGAVSVADPSLKAYYPLNLSQQSGLGNGNAASWNGFTAATPETYVAFKDAVTFSSTTPAIASTVRNITGKLQSPLQNDDSVWVSTDSGSTWKQATATAGTATWSLQDAVLSAGKNLQIRVSDLAGNDGTMVSYDLAAVPILDLDSNSAGKDLRTNISGAVSGIFYTILPNVAAVTDTDLANITLDFSESTNPLHILDYLKVGTLTGSELLVDLNSNTDMENKTGNLSLGSLTGLDYVYNSAEHKLSLFRHDGSALDAGSIAAALGNLQFMCNSSGNLTGPRNFEVQLIDMAGNTAYASGQIVL